MNKVKDISFPDVIGMTLGDFAQARGRAVGAVREEYTRMLRGSDLVLPDHTRIERGEGTKFCLPLVTSDGEAETESVLIPMEGKRGNKWHTLCVSSQIGCRMACTFCETARMGLIANLSAADIVGQRLAARRYVSASDAPAGQWRFDSDGIRNIVFMGMGEPFDNFDEVAQAVRVLNEPAGLNIPLSRMTISTVGRVDGIRRLASSDISGVRLAVSLNAARDSLRDTLMPLNRSTPLEELQQALLDYPLPRRGRILVEYVLIKDVNDSLEDADLVATWCEPLSCTINLIPYNPQSDSSYEPPEDATVVAFLQRLQSRGHFVKIRARKGTAMMAACGQLGNPALRRIPERRRKVV